MGICAALYSGSKCYFFDGRKYIRVTRGDTGAGTVDPGYPKNLSQWGWPSGFARFGIDAALYSGPKCYFFDGRQYIRVTRGDTGAGTVDAGYPKDISGWGWPSGFGSNGIDAALFSGSKCYFFDGRQYIRVTRGDTGPGTVDPGYPKDISGWGWPGRFGRFGIDAALYSRSKCYFFDGSRYVRVTRGDTGPGTVDPGYSKNISVWGWPRDFGSREFVVVYFKSLLPITTAIQGFIDRQYTELDRLYAKSGIEVRRGSTEDLSGDPDLAPLITLDVGPCLLGQPTDEHEELFANRDGAGDDDLVIYIVQTLQSDTGNFVGCATHPDDQPGAAIVQANAPWLLAHEVGHVLGLRHVSTTPSTNSDFLMWRNISWTNTPPDISDNEASTMAGSDLSRPV